MDMHLQQLLCFVTVADEHNFTRAAARLHMAQPSLSKQINNLERELGSRLFDRGHGGVRITAVGEALMPYALRILRDVETARLEVGQLTGLSAGRIRVGALPSLCTTVLADSLQRFHAEYPAIQLHVEEAGSRELVRHLDEGGLDLAMIVLPLLRDDPDLMTRPILTEELVLATAADDLSITASALKITDLRDLPLVMFREGYDLRSTTVAACHAAGFEPSFAVEGGDMDAVLSFVEAGLGAAVVPVLALRGRPALRQIPFAAGKLRRTIVLARLSHVHPSRASQAFQDVVMRTAATFAYNSGQLSGGA
jgi:DNA-binding transcriptional LysR family regulator